VRTSVLTDLGLPADPEELLARHTATLDATYRAVLARLPANTAVSVDDAGKVHVAGVKAIEEPASLVELRKRVAAMMPRVDISEAILEVLGWYPPFLAGLTSISGSGSRLADMDITVAACLTGQALNITYTPIAVPGVPALERHRIGYVDHTFLRAENYAAANPTLVTAQAGIGFAQALGGGLVAAIDGMRFVVPVPSIYARPNKKYFGPKRGITWLNMINDQAVGIGSKIVSGTDRDCLHALDVVFGSGEGRRADVIVTDTGSYSDLVRARAFTGQTVSTGAGGPAGSETLAHRPRRGLRGAERPGSRPAGSGEGPHLVAGHPAAGRVDLHRGGELV